jgi:hypothetical protein
MIWIGIAIGFVCFWLGMFVMALCNAASEGRTVNLYVARWTRTREALRELRAAVQTFVEGGIWFVEMAEAMSKAAEVLDEG